MTYFFSASKAGAGLFQLVVTEFVFSKIINYATLRAAQVKARVSRFEVLTKQITQDGRRARLDGWTKGLVGHEILKIA